MARRKKKTTRRRRKAVARRPARKASPRRKAPARRRRRNPKGLLAQPAFKFGLTAVAGAAAAGYVSRPGALRDALQPLTFGGQLQPSTAAALVTIAAGWFFAKGSTRATILAAGAGMLVPQVTSMIAGAGAGSSASKFSAAKRYNLPRPKASPAAKMVRKHTADLIGA